MSNTTFEIQVQDDHVEKISQTQKPILALAELIWNSLDADADRVNVVIESDDVGGIRTIEVSDDGHGMDRSEAESLFSKLGGSWKRTRKYSRHKKRLLHGKDGKGRLRTFSLGRVVDWTSRYRADDGLRQFTISLLRDQPRIGQISAELPVSDALGTGVTVRVSELQRHFRSLASDETSISIAVIFALYMRQYPTVNIYYNGTIVNPRDMQENVPEKQLPDIIDHTGKTHSCALEIVEWKIKTPRKLFLCNLDGFPLDEISPGVQAPYLCP